ncbi:Bacteriohemerythrin [Azospirillaceae bacterium]
MPLVHWSEGISVGVTVLDDDHKHLIDLINQLYDAMQAGREMEVLEGIFNELSNYTQTHFAREEQMMEARKFPGLAAHKIQHVELTTRVQQFYKKFQSGEAPSLSLELLALFKTWLISHIRVSDFQYRPYIKEETVQ